MNITKAREESLTISLAAIVAWIPLIPLFWFVLKPLLINSVTEAIGGEIRETVQEEVAPMSNAFVVLLRRDTAALRRRIAQMEYKKDHEETEGWTMQDAKQLVDLRLQLEASQKALGKLHR